MGQAMFFNEPTHFFPGMDGGIPSHQHQKVCGRACDQRLFDTRRSESDHAGFAGQAESFGQELCQACLDTADHHVGGRGGGRVDDRRSTQFLPQTAPLEQGGHMASFRIYV